MILLDTNLVSEVRRAERADRGVLAWMAAQQPTSTFVSVVTIMELEVGVMLMERRDAAQGAVLRRWLETKVLPSFDGRILSLDLAAARRCAALHIPDRRPERDAMIAATALVHGLTVATRNIADFAGTGLTLVNPWEGDAAPGAREPS